MSAAAVMASELLASPLTFKGNITSSMSDTEYVATSDDKKMELKNTRFASKNISPPYDNKKGLQ